MARKKATAQRYYAENSDVFKERALAAKRRNRAYIQEAKQEPCTDCGQRYPFYVMQFDHVGTDKTANVADMVYHSLANIQAEIAKCELVCANCHAIRTYSRLDVKPEV